MIPKTAIDLLYEIITDARKELVEGDQKDGDWEHVRRATCILDPTNIGTKDAFAILREAFPEPQRAINDAGPDPNVKPTPAPEGQKYWRASLIDRLLKAFGDLKPSERSSWIDIETTIRSIVLTHPTPEPCKEPDGPCDCTELAQQIVRNLTKGWWNTEEVANAIWEYIHGPRLSLAPTEPEDAQGEALRERLKIWVENYHISSTFDTADAVDMILAVIQDETPHAPLAYILAAERERAERAEGWSAARLEVAEIEMKRADTAEQRVRELERRIVKYGDFLHMCNKLAKKRRERYEQAELALAASKDEIGRLNRLVQAEAGLRRLAGEDKAEAWAKVDELRQQLAASKDEARGLREVLEEALPLIERNGQDSQRWLACYDRARAALDPRDNQEGQR